MGENNATAGKGPRVPAWGAAAWRLLVESPAAPQGLAAHLVSALIIAGASTPFAGWRLAAAWLAAMTALALGERFWPRRGGGERAFAPFAWLMNAGYSVAALYLVLFHTQSAQTLGVTLYGVTMFQILARDYAHPRRLMVNLLAPIASMVLVQFAAAALLVVREEPWKLITLLASPYIVFRAFRAVQNNLNRAREHEREAVERLGESEARYRLIAERSPDVIIRYDLEGRVEYLSPAAREYGWDPAALSGLNVAAALHPDERERNDAFMADLAAGRPIQQGEENVWRVQTPDGRLVAVEGRSSPILGDDGLPVGAVAILRDVTRRMALESELSASEQKLRGLFELAPLGIALTDMNGRYVEFNDAFVAITGYDAGELGSLDYWDLTPKKYEEDEARQLEALAQTGRYGPYEKEYIRKDGTLIPLRLNGMVVTGPGGERYIWSIVEDITAQRRSEGVLIEARNAAEAAALAKSEFLANMSHEIRTPLTAVTGFAGLLEAMGDLPEDARRYANRIATSAEALLLVVNDVLDFSKLEAGKVELDVQPFDPRAFVEETADLVRKRAGDKGLGLEVRADAALPAGLAADSGRLRQVLLNLLTNAVKFTERGRVSVEATWRDGRLRVAVTDTGIGVAPDLARDLFQRFSQVDASSTRQHGGTGLGLAISKAIVELMGGRIGMESQPGQGSTFWFEIPAPAAAAPAAPALAEAVDADMDRTRVLVVDDVAVNRELVSTMLAPFDVRITLAASGAEAVKASLSAQFDIILMDLQMPGMDGLAAARAIRSNSDLNRRTPILALSANVLPAQVAECLAAGMDDHVAKPINPRELLTKIAHWTAVAAAA